MHDDPRRRARGDVKPVRYHVVVQTEPANPEVAPYVLSGTLTSLEIHRLRDSSVGLARIEGRPIDVEITLAGDQKETAAYELAERLAGLSRYDIYASSRLSGEACSLPLTDTITSDCDC